MRTKRLPGRWADLLLRHLKVCRVCDRPNFCPKGRELIRRTTKERHG